MLMDNELTLKSQAVYFIYYIVFRDDRFLLDDILLLIQEVARNKLIDNIVELFKEACKNPNAHDVGVSGVIVGVITVMNYTFL